MNENNTTRKIGKAAALTAGVCTLLFALLIVLDFFVKTSNLQFFVCFFLALSYVVVANALYSLARPERKIWGRISLSFSVMYAVYICLVYYSQLTVVRLGLVPESLLPLINYVPGNWLFAADMLGYALLALSTLAGAFLFEKSGREKAIRALLLIHGMLAVPTAVFPALPIFGSAEAVQSANVGGAVALLAWCAIFAPICFLLVGYFGRKNPDIDTNFRGV
jgi:hypothetical protein